ncbi:nitric oxide reductase NorQ protein [Rhodoblastus acidophilus]|uniref:Nitric oxide reductase NorQ protein n=1 Tax=Rhodoblastus acidophilus TaxID=1074 RepID=A0A212R953_RHOAC|nr:CbbQ/NirQ/NorQ/GpvN family protein [Rhodoblastus acidophilus]PPQ37914.1 CbbQ/NirQ/NorQ/GpvN family protein [Rhodoblastus acidophilus]RAI24023.1 CbbQ/NirQ/NorQ/GpvN family protein [Rhodoblastus acidophilus]SNB68576.1 nitric oxide reductase NorQ protein [Rhodoblastus acidophilus]
MHLAAVAAHKEVPFYQPQGRECEIFEAAFRRRLPVLLKGPTGCGKTRFVAHMAAKLNLPLDTIACHDDLAAADLTGRYLIKNDETVWSDGPLTRAVRRGGICYLDEVVEARKDVTVVLHPLTDDRRILPLDRTGETLHAPDDFMLVISYNPGYQSVLKTLKPSTRQRFVAISFDYPNAEAETEIVARESGLAAGACAQLVRLAGRLRALKGQDLEEGASTRLLVACASLMADGMKRDEAIEATLIEPLTDDFDVRAGLRDLAQVTLG